MLALVTHPPGHVGRSSRRLRPVVPLSRLPSHHSRWIRQRVYCWTRSPRSYRPFRASTRQRRCSASAGQAAPHHCLPGQHIFTRTRSSASDRCNTRALRGRGCRPHMRRRHSVRAARAASSSCHPVPTRLASSDAWFCIAETRLGLAADVGTLQVRVMSLLYVRFETRDIVFLHPLVAAATHHRQLLCCARMGVYFPKNLSGRSALIFPSLSLHLIARSVSLTFIQALQAGLLSR
jgi:hypothetical protein